jgi:hypothetical protein
MRAGSAITRSTRHVFGVTLQALLIAAIVAVFSFAAALAAGGNPAGAGFALAAKPLPGHITVVEPVAHGQSTTATVNPGGSDVYVRVRCYAPSFGGTLVYGRFFDVDSENHATIGPLASSLWTSGGASCNAQEGYVTRDGFGKWVVLASTNFTVTP